jgi:hypothetical protein
VVTHLVASRVVLSSVELCVMLVLQSAPTHGCIRGAVFLWFFWPSLNSALVDGDEQKDSRELVNIVYSQSAMMITNILNNNGSIISRVSSRRYVYLKMVV